MADAGESNVFVSVRIRPRIQNAQNISQSAERHMPTAAARVGDDSIRMTDLKQPGGGSAMPSSLAAAQSGTFAASQSMTVGPADVKAQSFTFDAVFDEDSTQEELYNETTLNAVDAALQGANSTIMTYGQTGSGKTFTVLGVVSQNPLDGDDVVVKNTGLFLRALRDILQYRKRREAVCHVVVCISVIEIYLDNVRDLLGKDASANLRVGIHTDSVEMPDLTVQPINALRDAVACYNRATSRRVSRATDANDQSSRSHAVFAVEIFQQERTEKNPEPMSAADLLAAKDKSKGKANQGLPFSSGVAGMPPLRHSRIVLTDLAGSEKMKNKNSKGEALEEMKKINGSLTCLGNVVHSLHSGSKHIPYRDSKLTIILRSSFASPRAHVVLIANVAPTSLTYDETLSTLFFANKVKAIKSAGTDSKDAQSVLAESEMLATLKSAESLCCDLAIATATFGHLGYRPGVARRLGLRTGKSGVAAVAPAKKLVEEAAVRHRAECSDHQGNLAKVEAAELEEMRAKRHEEHISGTVTRRKTLNERVAEAAAEAEAAGKIKSSWEGDQSTVLAEAQAAADVATKKLAEVQSTHGAKNKEKADLDAQLASAKSKLDKIEADFKAEHASEANEWDAEDLRDEKLSTLFDSHKALFELHQESRGMHADTFKARAEQPVVALEADAAKKDYSFALLSEWIRPIVLGAVDDAVIQSRRARLGARRAPAVGVRPSAPPRPPKSLPGKQSADGGGGGDAAPRVAPPVSRPAKHADPNAPEGDRPKPKLPPRPPPKKPEGPGPDGAAPAASPPRRVPPPPPEPKPSDTVFDSPTLVGDVVAYCATGAMLLKHGRSGRPHLRFFYLATANGGTDIAACNDRKSLRLYYAEDKDLRGTPGLPYVTAGSVTAVTLGQGTPTFERMKRRDDHFKSFSVHYLHNQETRTLDIVAGTVAELEAWVIALCAVSKVNPSFAKPVAELERLPPGQEISSEDIEMCTAWHIRPPMVVAMRGKLEESRQRRMVPRVPISPGALRFISNLDIFRANVLWRRFVDSELVANLATAQQYLEFDDDDDDVVAGDAVTVVDDDATPPPASPVAPSPAPASPQSPKGKALPSSRPQPKPGSAPSRNR